MEFQLTSYRHGESILKEGAYREFYKDILEAIGSISDEELRIRHEALLETRRPKSISVALNEIIKEKFIGLDWRPESPIFQNPEYDGDRWRLDFAKGAVSIEVAFNHGEAIAWNLIKPVLASELNHVKKAIQTEIGVVITATSALKEAGCFDSAVGEYEKFLRYLEPLSAILSVPMVIIGLQPPKTFKLQETVVSGKKIGKIIELLNVNNGSVYAHEQ